LRVRHAAGDISVIGPMARSAEDLEIEFRILADAYHERFPGEHRRPVEREVGSFHGLRIGVVLNDEYAEVDRSIEVQLGRLAEFLRSEGADVRVGWKPSLDSKRVHVVYELLMRAAISQDLTEADIATFEAEKDDPASPKSDLRTMFLQGVTMTHREWLRLNEERHAMAATWRGFFRECDFLLCPVLATPAFPHDERAPAWRTLSVNGRDVPFGRQLFWAGYAAAFFLPATVAPVGLSDDGLPIGVQIVGDQLDDLRCMRFARLLEERYRSFTPPPAYASAPAAGRS
jgi:amidase